VFIFGRQSITITEALMSLKSLPTLSSITPKLPESKRCQARGTNVSWWWFIVYGFVDFNRAQLLTDSLSISARDDPLTVVCEAEVKDLVLESARDHRVVCSQNTPAQRPGPPSR
jgi:hypothetical protein